MYFLIRIVTMLLSIILPNSISGCVMTTDPICKVGTELIK